MDGIKAFQKLSTKEQATILRDLARAKTYDQAAKILNSALGKPNTAEIGTLNQFKGTLGELALESHIAESFPAEGDAEALQREGSGQRGRPHNLQHGYEGRDLLGREIPRCGGRS